MEISRNRRKKLEKSGKNRQFADICRKSRIKQDVLEFGTKRPRVRIPPLRHKNPKCPSWVLRVFAIRNDGKESAAAAANEGSVSPVDEELMTASGGNLISSEIM